MSSTLPVEGSSTLKRQSIAGRSSDGRGGSLVFGTRKHSSRRHTDSGSFMSLSDLSLSGSGVIARSRGSHRRDTVSWKKKGTLFFFLLATLSKVDGLHECEETELRNSSCTRTYTFHFLHQRKIGSDIIHDKVVFGQKNEHLMRLEREKKRELAQPKKSKSSFQLPFILPWDQKVAKEREAELTKSGRQVRKIPESHNDDSDSSKGGWKSKIGYGPAKNFNHKKSNTIVKRQSKYLV